jgi:hypothetical protein
VSVWVLAAHNAGCDGATDDLVVLLGVCAGGRATLPQRINEVCPLPPRIALSYLTNLARHRGHSAVGLEAGSPTRFRQATPAGRPPCGPTERPAVVTLSGDNSQPESAVLLRNVSAAGAPERSQSRRTPTRPRADASMIAVGRTQINLFWMV